VFFFASAGASAAYLTVSEIFPMETRAMAIAFFYAIGTGIGGIVGPIYFGKLIESGRDAVVRGYYIGAGLMIAAGLVELVLGVHAAQRSLEDIAQPLTAQDAEEDSDDTDSGGRSIDLRDREPASTPATSSRPTDDFTSSRRRYH
jgi:MFS family permease